MARYLLLGLGVAAAGLAADEIAARGAAWHEAVHLTYVFVVAALVVALRVALDRERALARTDALTGVPNRRTFEEVAKRRIARMRRDGTPFTVVYLDVDGFKGVNDTLGHTTGDAVLREVGQAILRSVRACDTTARVGGDEFAVLLEGGDPEAVIDRLRETLEAVAREKRWPVGFSVGAVTFRVPPEDASELLRRTDAAMYVAKRRGGARLHRVA